MLEQVSGMNLRPPIWLWIFAAVSIAQTGVTTALDGASAIRLLFLPVEVLLLWLLLRGGRVVWCLLVASGAVTVIGVAWGEPVWLVALTAGETALLLAPASVRYVWKEASLQRSLMAADGEAYGWGARLVSGLLWEEMWAWIGKSALNWGFIGRLALVVFSAKVVEAVLYADRHHSLLIAVPYRAAVVVAVSGFLLLLALLIAVGIRALARRIQPRTRGIS